MNAAGGEYITTIGGGIGGTPVIKTDGSVAPKAGDTLSIKKCIAKCPEEKVSRFSYTNGKAGGLLRLKHPDWQNMVITAPVDAKKKVKAGYVKLGQCGDSGKNPADVKLCGNLPNAQWELAPMFQVETKKKAISCSPYGHKNVEPKPCTSAKQAQILCAKDPKCIAYNWVDATALGKDTNKVWLCQALHDIHLPTLKHPLDGWTLGTRSGAAEDPYEKNRSHEESHEEYL